MSDRNPPACTSQSHTTSGPVTGGQVLLPASPFHVRVNDEHPVLTLCNASGTLLLEQLLHFPVIDEIFILLLLLLITEVICVPEPRCGEDKRPALRGGRAPRCSRAARAVKEAAGHRSRAVSAGPLHESKARAKPPQSCHVASRGSAERAIVSAVTSHDTERATGDTSTVFFFPFTESSQNEQESAAALCCSTSYAASFWFPQ